MQKNYSFRNRRQKFSAICLIAIVLAMCLVPVATGKMLDSGKTNILVGGEIDYPPYSFLDENGQPTGFQVELIRAVAKTMGMNIEIRLSPWPEARKALEDGTIDVIPGMFYSEERAKLFDFSPPFAILSVAIFARDNSPSVKSVEDLRNKEIIVMRGEVMHDYILKHRLTERILLAETPADVLRLLASGKGDYAFVAQMPGFYWIQELNLSNIKSVGPSLAPFQNCFAVKKGNKVLLSRFTEGFNILNQTGEYRRLHEKWLSVLEPTRITFGLAVRYAAIVFVPLILLLAGSSLWTWMLRAKVNQKTKELQESEERYRTLVENASDIIFRTDNTGHFTFVNLAALSITGYKEEEVIGMHYPALIRADMRDEAVKFFGRQFVKKLHNTYSEYPNIKKDGHEVWLGQNTQLIVEDGIITGFQSVARDITDRKRVEDALRASEENYRRSLDESPLGVRIVTAKTETIYANQAILDFYGYDSIEELKSTPVEKRYTHQSYAEFQIRREKRKHGIDVLSEYTIEIIRKNGEIRHLQVYRKEILWNGAKQNQVIYQDITERKKGEEALVKSEEKFRLITENMVDCVALVDINGIYQYVTPSYRNILGYDQEDMIGIKGLNLTHPDDLERNTRIYLEGIEQGWSEKQFETRTRHKDGHYVNMELRARVLNDSQGKVIGAIWTARDITKRLQLEQERKLAEDALSLSEENYRSVIENIQDVFYRTDTNGILIMASLSFATLLEYESLDDCLGKHITEVAYYEPEKRQAFLKALQDKGSVTNYEVVLKRKDGTPVTVETNSHFYLDDDGNIAGVEGIYRDMTERKRAEESLRVSEEKFRSVVEKSAVGVAIVDDTFLCTYVNKECCNISGYSEQEIVGRNFTFLLADESIIMAADRYQRRQRGEDVPSQYEFIFVRKNGEKRTGEVRSAIYLDSSGRVNSLIQVIDITDRKQAEEEKRILEERLQQADKMEAIGTLAGGIAHDFNNLLMGIQGYASMALLNLDPANPNYERLKRIEQQVQSGADLTSQLLGFARGGRYEVKPTNMNEIIEKTSSMFGRTKKEISINRKSTKDLWNVEVDRGQMEQVFLNLYVNAWQAMPGGGEIYLETQNALLNDEQAFPYTIKPGKYVKITITDTGTGMDEKTQERIFDPFFTTKEMGRGTGLGLATVYGIIKGHHGIINVYSETGHGTTFTIYLPASEKEILKEETPKDEITRGTETILLIDDEQMVMEVNQELLESMGYKVYVAGSGQEGIAVYMEKKDKIDLVILDMIMPGISGSETFDRLRKINPNIKVLLSSGYSLNGEAKHIMDRGCNGFLQKPFKLEELSGKVRAMLN